MRKHFILLVFSIILLTTSFFKCTENQEQAIEDLRESNNTFAFDLYQELKNDKGNLFYSPYSLFTALSMTYAGAENETAEAMKKVLSIENEAQFHSMHQYLNHQLKDINAENIKLDIANGMWMDANWTFLPDYKSLIQTKYNAGIESIDMRDGVKSANMINSWIAEQTNNKIQDIVNPDDFDLARLVLANAIYFYAPWKVAFNEELSREDLFYLHDKSKAQMEFMFKTDTLNYFENDSIQMLEVPYENEEFSLFIVLPDRRKGIRNIEEDFSLMHFERFKSNLQSVEIEVQLPKFTLDYEKEFKELLSKLGMSVAFSRAADFSGMTGRKDLQIDKVKHKSFFEINEKGSEASAATVVIMREKSALQKKSFRANRPFIFIIQDNRTESILFMGRFEKPGI